MNHQDVGQVEALLIVHKQHPFSRIKLKVHSNEAGMRIDKFLASKVSNLSRSRAKNLIEEGFVKIDGQHVIVPKKKLLANDKITLTLPEAKPIELKPEPIPLDIVYEDQHLIIINKQAGLIVHPGAGNLTGTLVHGLLAKCDDLSGIGGKIRPGIVHRLDKDTSGLIIIAKNDRSHQLLTEKFQKRQIEKRYLAIIAGKMDDRAGVIDLPIGRHTKNRTKMAVDFRNGRAAQTSYETIKELGPHQLLELRLHTGRTHQIRVHLSHMKHPILGDRTYRGPTRLKTLSGMEMKISRQMLHAKSLAFDHPITGQNICLKAPVPKDMKDVIDILSQLPD